MSSPGPTTGGEMVVAQHRSLLQRLGFTTLDGVRAYQGDFVKNHRRRRDVVRIVPPPTDAACPVLFLKRILKPYRKDGLASLLRRGRVWSNSRQEWENSLVLQRAGFPTARLVAYGEQCGPFWEHFSFIITESADGDQTVDEFLKSCRQKSRRALVIHALARTVRELHDAGLASPDLFARHFFLNWTERKPRFCLIDMARLDRVRTISYSRRARDLAALNVSLPDSLVSPRERLRFLRLYAGGKDRKLARLIRHRMTRLLKQRRHRFFWNAAENAAPPPDRNRRSQPCR